MDKIKTPIEWNELAEDFLDADDCQITAEDVADALNTATAREARLVEALERLRDCDWVISLPDRMDAVREIAREALADINPNGDEK